MLLHERFSAKQEAPLSVMQICDGLGLDFAELAQILRCDVATIYRWQRSRAKVSGLYAALLEMVEKRLREMPDDERGAWRLAMRKETWPRRRRAWDEATWRRVFEVFTRPIFA
jgi:hypothetical protein